METNLNKVDYYKVGDRNNLVISNSFLTALNPDQGGSPQKALAFLDNNLEASEEKHLYSGRTIHKYCEKPEEFAVADVPRPSDMLGDFTDEFYKLSIGVLIADTSPQAIEITSKLKTESGRSAEIAATKAAYEKLANLLGTSYEATVVRFRQARTITNAYKSYNEGTLVEKFISSSLDYFKQIASLNGKIALTMADKDMIESVKNSLYTNRLINKYWNLSKSFDTNIIWKELDIYYDLDVYGVPMKCKARLDNVYIDLEEKTIYLNDLKTTSKPLGLFRESFEKYRYYRQLAWYTKALMEYLKKEYPIYKDWKIVPQIVAVETTGNFQSCVYRTDAYAYKGIQECLSLCKRAYYHQKNNVWDMSMEQHQGNGIITLKPEENGSN